MINLCVDCHAQVVYDKIRNYTQITVHTIHMNKIGKLTSNAKYQHIFQNLESKKFPKATYFSGCSEIFS